MPGFFKKKPLSLSSKAWHDISLTASERRVEFFDYAEKKNYKTN